MIRSLVLAAVLCAVPDLLAAQERECDLSAGSASRSASEPDLILLHDPFIVTCNDGAMLMANSGRLNDATRELYLVGDVFFQDVERKLTADEATYNNATAYLFARGNVVFEDHLQGSTLRGPNLEYFRATDTRPESQMSATERPVLTINRQNADEIPEPIELVADRVNMVGENDLSAFGSVEITRSDLNATSAEARYNSETEELELRQNAVIVSGEYELTGEVVQARLVENSIEYLHARTNTSLTGEELQVTGDDLKIFFEGEQIQRAVAIGGIGGENGALATASSPTFRLEADSLDAAFEAERLREVYAIGNAHGESIDTTAVAHDVVAVSADAAAIDHVAAAFNSDWVKGDTIIGYFTPQLAEISDLGDPAVEADTIPGTAVDLRKLVAIGRAQSLYRLRAQDEPSGERRTLNFLTGARIELDMIDGELAVAEVSGLQYGMYLEAAGASSPSPPAVEPDGTTPPSPPDI